MPDLRPEDGRRAFGRDPAAYDRSRPDYPDIVFETLAALTGPGPWPAFEIGPGGGLATRKLLSAGAAPLIAIEPDARLAGYLAEAGHANLHVLNATFEEADLPPESFDLGVAATSLHWLDQGLALAKAAKSLRPGGWFCHFANVFGDPRRQDDFHDATDALLNPLPMSRSGGGSALPFALDTLTRLDDLTRHFGEVRVEYWPWTLVLDSAATRALYATFSNITLLPDADRERILDGLFDIAERQFAGRVERNMVTSFYAARRNA